MTGTEILTRARTLCNDDGTRLLDADALNWINDAVAEIVALKPNSFPSTVLVSLQPGTRQTITGTALLKVTRNMGSNGTVPGKAVKSVAPDVMDAAYPGWHEAVPVAAVSFVILDPKEPKVFYVFPPQPSPATQQIETVQAVIPAKVTSLAAAVPVPDEYAPAIPDYILFRQFGIGDDGAMFDRSNRHYQRFIEYLTGKASSEGAMDPREK